MTEWIRLKENHNYAISNFGAVRNLNSGRILKATIGTNGRPQIGFRVNGKTKTKYIHQLLCSAFHGDCPTPQHVASHVDGNMLHNVSSNVIWETQRENLARKWAHGTGDSGFDNSRAILEINHVTYIHAAKAVGFTDQAIADHLGVSRPTISRVLNGLRYTEEG